MLGCMLKHVPRRGSLIWSILLLLLLFKRFEPHLQLLGNQYLSFDLAELLFKFNANLRPMVLCLSFQLSDRIFSNLSSISYLTKCFKSGKFLLLNFCNRFAVFVWPFFYVNSFFSKNVSLWLFLITFQLNFFIYVKIHWILQRQI